MTNRRAEVGFKMKVDPSSHRIVRMQEPISRNLHMCYNLDLTLSRENVFLGLLIFRENSVSAKEKVAAE